MSMRCPRKPRCRCATRRSWGGPRDCRDPQGGIEELDPEVSRLHAEVERLLRAYRRWLRGAGEPDEVALGVGEVRDEEPRGGALGAERSRSPEALRPLQRRPHLGDADVEDGVRGVASPSANAPRNPNPVARGIVLDEAVVVLF